MTINLSNLESLTARRFIITVLLIPVAIFAAFNGARRELGVMLATASYQWRKRA